MKLYVKKPYHALILMLDHGIKFARENGGGVYKRSSLAAYCSTPTTKKFYVHKDSYPDLNDMLPETKQALNTIGLWPEQEKKK